LDVPCNAKLQLTEIIGTSARKSAERPHQPAVRIERTTTIAHFAYVAAIRRTTIRCRLEHPMSSKKQKLSSHGKKPELRSDLSRHYRQIGIMRRRAAPRVQKVTAKRKIVQRKIVERRIPMSDARHSRAARESTHETMATGAETVRGVQEGFTSALENVRGVNLRLIDMAQANTQAAFDFAREVANAKGPSDFIQACTTNATKQLDMLTKQGSELTTLCQRFATEMPKPKGP
jgi:hypothetical protein